MIIRSIFAAASLIAATSASGQQTVRLIDSEMTKGCSYVDTQITAAIGKLSDLGKWDQGANAVEQRLRASAIERAIKINGNAIHYRNLTASGTMPMLMFDIYICPSSAP